MTETPVKIRLRSRLVIPFTVAGAAMGGLLAMAIGPISAWLMRELEQAPALVEQLDRVPLTWSVPLLMALGAVVGYTDSSRRDRNSGGLVIDTDCVTVEQPTETRAFRHRDISEAFLDGTELVLLGRDSRELIRVPAEDGLGSELKEAFEMHGLLWSGGGDPRDSEFHPWVDHSRELDAELHAMLRERRRALELGQIEHAQTLRDQLAAHGVIVRDRTGAQQQIRVLPG